MLLLKRSEITPSNSSCPPKSDPGKINVRELIRKSLNMAPDVVCGEQRYRTTDGQVALVASSL